MLIKAGRSVSKRSPASHTALQPARRTIAKTGQRKFAFTCARCFGRTHDGRVHTGLNPGETFARCPRAFHRYASICEINGRKRTTVRQITPTNLCPTTGADEIVRECGASASSPQLRSLYSKYETRLGNARAGVKEKKQKRREKDR